jgi:hypothetical protein
VIEYICGLVSAGSASYTGRQGKWVKVVAIERQNRAGGEPEAGSIKNCNAHLVE